MAWYRAGTITLTAGSATVVGAGTAWVKYARAGDLLSLPGQALEVKSITSDTQLELALPYSGAGGAGIGYALVPTQGYVPDALAAMQQILNEFGDIWQAWQAGDLQGRGLVLKGSVNAVADLPADGNAEGDGYIVAGSKLYVWSGTEWAYAGEMVTTTELIQLRDATLAARQGADISAGGAAAYAESAAASAELAVVSGAFPYRATIAAGVAGPDAVADGARYAVAAGGADALLQTALFKNAAGVAVLERYIADGRQALITSGNALPSLVVRAQGLNGGMALLDSDGRLVGVLLPAGATARTSYVIPDIPSAELRGLRLRIVQRYLASAGFLAAVTLSVVKAQYRAGAVTAELAVTNYSIRQNGTEIVQTGDVIVPDNADYVGFLLQLAQTSPVLATEHSVKVTGTNYGVVSSADLMATDNDRMVDLRLRPVKDSVTAVKTYADGAMLGLGEFWGTSSVLKGTSVVAAGGVKIGADPNATGIAIPANAGNGQGSSLSLWGSAAGLAGKTIEITAFYTATANFLTDSGPNLLTLQVRRNGVITNVFQVDAPRTQSQTGTTLKTVTRYTVTAADTDIAPAYMVSGGSMTKAYDRSLVGQSVAVVPVAAAGRTRNDAVLQVVVDQKVDKAVSDLAQASSSYTTTIIQAGPSRALTTPQAANAAVVDKSASKRTEIQLDAADYNGGDNWKLAPFATLKGFGRSKPHIHFERPAGDPRAVADYHPMYVPGDGALDTLWISARNARYAVHAESSNENPNALVTVRSCLIEHLGDDTGTWSSPAAWGSGISSGWRVLSEGNIYRSPFCAFSYHTNIGFARASYVENRGDVLVGTAVDGQVAGLALRLQPIGSGQKDQYRAFLCQFDGDIYYHPDPWKPTTLDYQPASHAEIEMVGCGNTPAVFRVNDFGRALKIASTGGAGSSVAVSGSAVAVLFGTVTTYAGATNLPGYVHGSFDISGTAVGELRNIFITSLGKRLGDCTAVNKALTVVVNGGAPITITFNQNYTDATNASILNTINAALGGAAVATAYALGERYRPSWIDEERTLQNATAVGIPMGSVLAYDGSYKRVRLMTSADPASLFAGVAWEDIYPNTWGRVKTQGYLPLTDVRTSAEIVVFGSTMSVGATPGNVQPGGSQGLLAAIRPDAVRVA